MINISLLGIRVGVDDAPTLGALAMLIALIWFYLSVRREHYVIAYLLHDYRGPEHPVDVKWRIFHGIISYAVFTNVRHFDNPFKSIDHPPAEGEMKLLRPLMSNLYYLPLASLVFVLLFDAWSVFRPSPFRTSNDWLFTILWKNEEYGELTSIIIWWVIGLLLAFPNGFLCRKISDFAHSTEHVLGQYWKLIKKESDSKSIPTSVKTSTGQAEAAQPTP
jgi:hypothetical protein